MEVTAMHHPQDPGMDKKRPLRHATIPHEGKKPKPAEMFASWLQPVVDCSPIPQFVIGRDHCIRFWNKALERYSGLSAAEMVGTSRQWQAFYQQERPTLADVLLEGKTEEIAQLYDGRYNRSALIEDAWEATDFFPQVGKKGTWLHFTAALIRDATGEVLGAVETLEDITDLMKAEELIAYMTEMAMRITQPVGIIRENLQDIARLTRDGKLVPEEIAMLLDTQVRNATQIQTNVVEFQKSVVEKHQEIPEAYRKFLSG